jgi:hypothetical protein
MNEMKLALYLMLGQSAAKEVRGVPGFVPLEPLRISDTDDLAEILPDAVGKANDSAEVYKLFFVFERYLRQLVISVLSRDGKEGWWEKVPKDVQDEISKLEDTEETKSWMSLGSRDKSALITYPQLLKIIEHRWKEHFEDLLRDKALLQEARLIGHLRNAICHMSSIPEEEKSRIRQTIRDWFRRIAP